MRKREKNLDLLRVICTIMVIVIHVAAQYGKEIHLTSEFERFPNYYFSVGNFYHSISRFAVPIFVMLSGAFLLENNKNGQYKFFYKKTLKNIIIPTLIFSLLYVLYSLFFEVIKPVITSEASNYLLPFKNWIIGSPYYHMWYMYMIIGCYVITPFIIKIKQNINLKHYKLLGWIFLAIGIILNLTCNLIWPLTFIQYLGYFILGDVLKSKYTEKKISYKKPLFLSVTLLLMLTILQEIKLRNLFLPDVSILSPLSPIVIVASILLFISFLNMRNIKIDCSKWAYHSFNIYLFHAGVLSIINTVVNRLLGMYFNPIWYIPFLTVVIFIISYICSIIYNNIMSYDSNRKCFKNKLVPLKN